MPTTKCRLRLLKLERIKDFLLMEEEFIQVGDPLPLCFCFRALILDTLLLFFGVVPLFWIPCLYSLFSILVSNLLPL